MAQLRSSQAKLNIAVTLVSQLVTLICGIIVPTLIISGFGSEAYGATTSITQFLSYIALLEGGVGSVARAALYKPLADKDEYRISLIMKEIKRFFMIIGIIFIFYVLILACTFKTIADVTIMDWLSTFLLVIVISFSNIAQYFMGISNTLLLNAANRAYVVKAISIVTVVLNAVMVFVLVQKGCNLIIVKLGSSLVFAARPFFTWLYVKKHYTIVKCKERDPSALAQKWEGLGQHIAYFLHYNTDVAILTICSDLKTVAVYSVYHMIIYQIQNITFSFSAGMEAVFGDLWAKKEHKSLQKWFEHYETLISIITGVLYSTTISVIVPFVKLYTAGVSDANYIQPLFAVVLTVASIIYCLRLPYHSMTIAAGHFKQTRAAAYGEAVINIVLSVILVWNFGLVGVAAATFIATLFRFLYYVVYLSKHILKRSVWLFVKRTIVNGVSITVTCVLQVILIQHLNISNYTMWFVGAVCAVAIATVVIIVTNLLMYKESTGMLLKSMMVKVRK